MRHIANKQTTKLMFVICRNELIFECVHTHVLCACTWCKLNIQIMLSKYFRCAIIMHAWQNPRVKGHLHNIRRYILNNSEIVKHLYHANTWRHFAIKGNASHCISINLVTESIRKHMEIIFLFIPRNMKLINCTKYHIIVYCTWWKTFWSKMIDLNGRNRASTAEFNRKLLLIFDLFLKIFFFSFLH